MFFSQTLSFSDEEGVQDEEFKGKPGRQSLQNKEKREAEHKPVEMEASSMDNEKLNQVSFTKQIGNYKFKLLAESTFIS